MNNTQFIIMSLTKDILLNYQENLDVLYLITCPISSKVMIILAFFNIASL